MAEWIPDGTDNQIHDLLYGEYACTRSWEAWQYGTMTEADFTPMGETEIVGDLLAWRDAALAVPGERIAAAMQLHRSGAYGKCMACSEGYECGDWAPDWPCETWLALESPDDRAAREAEESREAREKAMKAAIEQRDALVTELAQARAETKRLEDKRDALAAELDALESR